MHVQFTHTHTHTHIHALVQVNAFLIYVYPAASALSLSSSLTFSPALVYSAAICTLAQILKNKLKAFVVVVICLEHWLLKPFKLLRRK